MSIYSVDWSSLFSPSSILLPDISFKIISEGRKAEVVEAHRTVLCLLSPVFRAYLSEGGSWHNATSQILIKDISLKPFQTMLDFFYKKDFNISNKFRNIEELFEILKLADQYQVETLVNLCKKSLLNYPMKLKSVVQIVNAAKYYNNLEPFATISQDIFDRATDFLSTKLETAADVLNFLAQSNTDKTILEDSIKLELLKDIASKKCEKCDFLSKGVTVTHENMIKEAWVEVTQKSKFSYDSFDELEVGKHGQITGISRTKGRRTKYTIAWENQPYDLTYHINKDLHVPMKYICKCNVCPLFEINMDHKECDSCGPILISSENEVTLENMVVGARVEVTEKSKFTYDSSEELDEGEQGTITKVTDTEYTIEWKNVACQYCVPQPSGERNACQLTYEKSRDFHIPMKFVCKCKNEF